MNLKDGGSIIATSTISPVCGDELPSH